MYVASGRVSMKFSRILREETRDLGIDVELRAVGERGDLLTYPSRLDGRWIIYYTPKLLAPKYARYARQVIRHEICHLLDLEEGLYELYMKGVGDEEIDECVECVYLAYTDLLACERYLETYGDYDKYLKLAKKCLRDLAREDEADLLLKSLKYAVAVLLSAERGVSGSSLRGLPRELRESWRVFETVYGDLRSIARAPLTWDARAEALTTEALMLLAYLKSIGGSRVEERDALLNALYVLESTDSYSPLVGGVWLERFAER